MVAEQDLFSLQILTCLQTLRLDVASNGEWDLSTLSPLQHLTALKQLHVLVHDLRPGPMLVAPGLSQLTFLTSLSLEQEYSGQGCVCHPGRKRHQQPHKASENLLDMHA